MNIQALKGKNILIVGRGKEGRAAQAYLEQLAMPGTRVTIVDQTDGPAYLSEQTSFDIAIKSPGVPRSLLQIPYTTSTNIFFANAQGKVIGVTGTKGKSTTSSLIYAMLKEGGYPVRLVGNIGNPALLELLSQNNPDTVYVYELSSYQLEDIDAAPYASVFINFFPEHMNYHGSVEGYWNAKKRIVEKSTVQQYFIYNPAYPMLRQLAKETRAQDLPIIPVLPFTVRSRLLGAHNEDNMRTAVTVARLFHVDDAACKRAIMAFTPLPHRLECVGTYKGITFYDDAISTTPESTVCAIVALPEVSTIFLGGLDRGYDFTPLVASIRDSSIRTIVLFPDSGKAIEQCLINHGLTSLQFFHTSSMEAAVSYAFAHTPVGSICLLSTASPSYSLWKNFEEKGDEFAKYVKRIGGDSL